ncbi:oxidoreductase, aldo/keto reductase family protein [Teladorsagia circumcincta]|uniref:Oxidoreductase, aldo/keto reductase family protein n=1 Tax=Teladorsagia circumcincta TaxID=45464 RepID=A0A2G9UHX9_TELCI|nr:oxidoreductase, aldo/keto reductase family protein [Teladorsagia circumcincta]
MDLREMASTFHAVRGGAAKLNTGFYIPLVGLGTYKVTGDQMMPCANQVEYHPHFTRDELKEYCKKEGVFFQAFSSLARHEPALVNDPVVVDLAKTHNTSVPIVLLSFALSQGVGIVPKSTNPQRIKDNLEMKPAVNAALGAGYRLFDTAKVYDNESDLGDALETCLPLHNLKREDVFLLTKIYPSDSSEDIRNMVDNSLRNLRTSYIDSVLIHFPKTKDAALNDPDNALHRKITYLSLEHLKKEGKIRSVGVSNYEVRHMEEIKAYGQAYSSLARHNPDLIEHPAVLQLAAKYEVSPQVVLLSWAVSQGVGVIPKSSNPHRIVDNLKVLEVVLEEAEVQRLRDLDRNKNYVRCEGWLELLPKHKLTRGDIFITTKFHMNADDPAGGARTLVMESLERLRTS